MKEFMKRIDVIVILILVASLGLNIYFINQKPNEVIKTITNTEYIENPITVTKIVTKYETKLVTESIVVGSNVSENIKANAYDSIINSELIINTTPLTIVEDRTGKIFIPDTLTGNARLAFLLYNINIELKPNTIYQKKTLPLDLGTGLANLQPELGVCMDIPFTDFDIMAGFKGINIGLKKEFTKNSKLRAGLGIDYDKNVFMFVGLRTNIF
jgi:hypothetical protein